MKNLLLGGTALSLVLFAFQAGAIEVEPIVDTAPAPSHSAGGVLSFDQALGEILSRSTAVSIQRSTLEAASERARPALLQFAPAFGLEASQTQTQVNDAPTSYRTRQVEAVAAINLFRGGADLAGYQAARADVATQRELLADTLLRIEGSAVAALVGQIARAREIAVLTSLVKLQADSLGIAEQRYAGGYLSLQETEQVSVDLSNTRARLADAQIGAIQATATLENLLGHARVATGWPWLDRLRALRKARGEGGQAASGPDLSRRPDWRAAQARLEAEERRAARGWRLLAPTLDADFRYGHYGNLNNDTGAGSWRGTLTLALPIFDRLVSYSGARAQGYVASAAETQLEQVRRDARADWEAASKGLDTAVDSALARDRTLEISRKLYQDNLRRFRAGRITVNDLFINQARLFEAELLAINGWSAAHLAYARLCRAQGLRLQDCR